jgi:hypothetical protein
MIWQGEIEKKQMMGFYANLHEREVLDIWELSICPWKVGV